MSQTVLAVDLGGTNLRIAAVDRNGHISARDRCPTPRSGDAGEIVKAITDIVNKLRGESEIEPEAIAVAAPVIMDLEADRIDRSPNLSQLNGYQLRSELSKAIGTFIYLENDATAAAIGENWLGVSKGAKDSICITLGTGVGGGIMIDGRPFRGPDGTAGEIGHICVEPEGHPCGCGARGCLEQYSSATAIVRFATELANDNSVLAGKPDLSAEDVYEAALKGDLAARECFRRMGYYLGIALSGLINVLNPEVMVLAGGLSSGWDAFIPETLVQIEKRAFRVPAKRVKLVRAVLGDDAGLLGAARIAFTSIEQRIKGV